MSLTVPSSDIIYFTRFCLSAISLLLEEARIHVFEIDRACFYCPLRLKIVCVLQ